MPIWFMEKRGGKGIDEISAAGKKKECKVIFKPDNKEISISVGATLLDAAQAGDIPLNASCNGKGSCGKCKLVLESGDGKCAQTPLLTEKEKENHYVLACQTTVHSDMVVRIPEETLEKKLKIAGMGKEVTDRMQGSGQRNFSHAEKLPTGACPPDFG